MTRRGYTPEYTIKKSLQDEFGKNNVIKVAIGQNAPDFLVLKKNVVLKGVEVKSTKKHIYRPKKHDREQFEFLEIFQGDTKIPVEYLIRTVPKGKRIGKWEVLSLTEFYKKYIRR